MATYRSIKFRGKSKNFHPDKQRFVYGSLSDWGDGQFSIRWRVKGSDTAWKTCGVIPETIGQSLGIVDKNGKEVFEGDIVRVWSQGVCRICVVVWNELNCYFFLRHPSEPWYISADMARTETFEVIGNIHDNPELINSKQ